MNVVESILEITDVYIKFRASCGHELVTTTHVKVGSPFGFPCPACVPETVGNRFRAPKPEDVLDAIVEEYVTIMHAQGVIIGVPERVAIRRAANIQYAWYCSMRAVLG